MIKSGRVRPSKGQSIIGMIVGIVFVIIGISNISIFGAFGVLWTLIAIAITISHGYNAFSEKGISTYQMDIETDDTGKDFDKKIRQLKALMDDGLITEEEYNIKRKEIIDEKW